MPEQSLDDWLAALAEKSRAKDIQDASELLASRMVKWCNVSNAKTWREAAARSTQPRKLYLLLQQELQGTATGARVSEIIRANANYISSLALEQAQVLTDEVNRAQQSGARPGTISKMMRTRYPELLRSRVHLIARTETAKASSALTEARAMDIGAEWYIWETSQDGDRVRTSHQMMQGVLCRWSDPPAPDIMFPPKTKHGHVAPSKLGHYNVGNCPNCRCVPIVVLSLDDVHFPAKVYHGGAIKMMNEPQFRATFANA
jgi:SPP1 gp7 family putative phage head morphogenesis protein